MYEHRGLCNEIELPTPVLSTSGVERMRITSEGFWILNMGDMVSTAAKCEALGIDPAFIDYQPDTTTFAAELDELLADIDAWEAQEQPSLPLEEMEKYWGDVVVEDFISRPNECGRGSLVQALPRARKHLSSR